MTRRVSKQVFAVFAVAMMAAAVADPAARADAPDYVYGSWEMMNVERNGMRYEIVMTIEKNREGPSQISFEFEKHFADFRFDPEGGFLSETLIDDTMFEQ